MFRRNQLEQYYCLKAIISNESVDYSYKRLNQVENHGYLKYYLISVSWLMKKWSKIISEFFGVRPLHIRLI